MRWKKREAESGPFRKHLKFSYTHEMLTHIKVKLMYKITYVKNITITGWMKLFTHVCVWEHFTISGRCFNSGSSSILSHYGRFELGPYNDRDSRLDKYNIINNIAAAINISSVALITPSNYASLCIALMHCSAFVYHVFITPNTQQLEMKERSSQLHSIIRYYDQVWWME